MSETDKSGVVPEHQADEYGHARELAVDRDCSPVIYVEFTIGGRDGLELHRGEAGLRNCIAAFTAALNVFDAAKQPSGT